MAFIAYQRGREMVSGMVKADARTSAVRCSVYLYLLADHNAAREERKKKLKAEMIKHLRTCNTCKKPRR